MAVRKRKSPPEAKKPLAKGALKVERPDYSAFHSEPKGHILGQLRKCAQDVLKSEAEVARLQDELDKATAKHKHLTESVLPALMESAESQTWTSAEGIVVDVVEQFEAYISEDHKPKAHAWLEENKLGDLIKRKFEIQFGRGDMAWALKFARDLRKRKRPLNFKMTEAVHAGTLKANVKSIVQEGELKIPFDLFGIFRKNVAKVTVPK